MYPRTERHSLSMMNDVLPEFEGLKASTDGISDEKRLEAKLKGEGVLESKI